MVIITEGIKAHVVDASADMFIFFSGVDHSGKVAFDISEKNRNAHIAESFRKDLKGYGFACTGGAGDKAVAVCHSRFKKNSFFTGCDPDFVCIFKVH